MTEGFIIYPKAEKELLSLADGQRKLSNIRKVLQMVREEKITKDNFYDKIQRLARNTRTDRGIRFWESFAEYAYDILFGDKAKEYQTDNSYSAKSQSGYQPKFVSNLSLRRGDTFYLKKLERQPWWGDFDMSKIQSLDPDEDSLRTRCNYIIYDGYVYDYTPSSPLIRFYSVSDLCNAMASGEEEPYARVVSNTGDWIECTLL